MLSSQKCNVTNHGFARITTVVWRFTVTVHDVQLYHDFQCLGAIEVTLNWNILASFYWKDNGRYREILVFTRPIIIFYYFIIHSK